jgi:hypothetical protein
MTAAVEGYLATRRAPPPAQGWIADDDLQHVERASLQLVQLDPTVLFDHDAPGYETLKFLMARACVFKNRRFFERLGAVLPCALIEGPPVIIPTRTDAEEAADDEAAEMQEEKRRQTLLTEWRQTLEARRLRLIEQLQEERVGKRFRALKQKIESTDEALEKVRRAARTPPSDSPRLREFRKQLADTRAAKVSPKALRAYRGQREQTRRRCWQRTEQLVTKRTPRQ